MSTKKNPAIDLARPPCLPDASIDAALRILKSGYLFRYGETSDTTLSDAALLEQEFSTFIGSKYCVAVNSGGSALFLALKAAGVKSGEPVLLNAFTLAPVPGAIHHAGAEPVLVETNQDCIVDLADLERKAKEYPNARFLLLSYMRGLFPNMEHIHELCNQYSLTLIEDCAHTLGARWRTKPLGSFGKAACFSAQSFKHINAGEGGLLATNDEDLAAAAILMSGSYMLYGQHKARPSLEKFEALRFNTPNYSLRMSDLSAAILRPQLALVNNWKTQWQHIYTQVLAQLKHIPGVKFAQRFSDADYVPSSLQFSLPSYEVNEIERLLVLTSQQGIHLKWFGADNPKGFTSRPEHWSYMQNPTQIPQTEKILSRLFDLRLPLNFTDQECYFLGSVLKQAIIEAKA
ncbi:MAG: DegT/DnrJ/EryC1/StrS aminotransferase family protein [Cellvibrionaceae bacterium]